MNYIKTFAAAWPELETVTNAFLRECAEKQHRVMHTQFHLDKDTGTVRAIFTIEDTPHPHWLKEHAQDGATPS